MKKTKIIVAMAIGLGACLPLIANADLVITNNTSLASTCMINDGACSDWLGAKGVTLPHSVSSVDQDTLNTACFFNPDNCKADVYMSPNCQGEMVATIYFNVNSGILSITPYANKDNYSVTGSGFDLVLNGK